jgi:hypothetical protein
MCIYVSNPLIEPAPFFVHAQPVTSPHLSSKAGASAPEFYQEAYDTKNNITFTAAPLNGPILPNGEWGVDSHPSDKIVAYDNTVAMGFNMGSVPKGGGAAGYGTGGAVYLDDIFAIGTSGLYAKTSMSGPIMNEFVKTGTFGTNGHSFGYASCQWLAHCNPGLKPGAECAATLSGVSYKGYCFHSDTGSLECGRLAAIDNEYGDKPITFDVASGRAYTATTTYPGAEFPIRKSEHYSEPTTIVASNPGAGKPYRCPAGSPAKGLGTFVSKRPLIAGCMITSDDTYDMLAEVHVPAYCTNITTDFHKGCMLPTAMNFDPTAKQSGACEFATLGCTDSTKLRYNPEATVDDGMSCLDAVYGCTVAETPYEGVNDDTPSWRSGEHGEMVRWIGMKYENSGYTGKAVTNYDSAANVNDGCVVAIEGCMDPTAANYDSAATINSLTWCVPLVEGCMMPPELPNGPYKSYDLGTSEFKFTATKHKRGQCFSQTATGTIPAARVGCTVPGAMNYDPTATVSGTSKYTQCYVCENEECSGCLNKGAVNFGCKEKQDDTTGCDASEVLIHAGDRCKYPGEPALGTPSPPSPPPPQAPEGGGTKAVVTYVFTVEFSAAGTVEENVALADDMIGAFAAKYDPPAGAKVLAHIENPENGVRNGPYPDCEDTSLYDSCTGNRRQLAADSSRRLQVGGVLWIFQIKYADAADAAAAEQASAGLSDQGALAAIFATAVPSLVVTSGATVAIVEEITYIESGLTDAQRAGLIAGVLCGVFSLAGAAFVYWRMKKKAAYAKTVVPA